jgi:hypothetical protein
MLGAYCWQLFLIKNLIILPHEEWMALHWPFLSIVSVQFAKSSSQWEASASGKRNLSNNAVQ